MTGKRNGCGDALAGRCGIEAFVPRIALTICRLSSDGNLRTPGANVLFIKSYWCTFESRWLPSRVSVAVKLSPTKTFEPLMFFTWRSKPGLPLTIPSKCPISCKTVVSRSYLPTASPVVARNAVSSRV